MDLRRASLLTAAQRVWAHELPSAANAEEANQAVLRVYGKLAGSLSPVLGEAGLHALLARSVKLTQPSFACLSEVTTRGRPEVVLDQLRLCLEQQPQTPVIKEIGVAVLARFTDLLATFIGEGLAWRLLHNAWPEALPSDPASPEQV